jgi:hypothetical protein
MRQETKSKGLALVVVTQAIQRENEKPPDILRTGSTRQAGCASVGVVPRWKRKTPSSHDMMVDWSEEISMSNKSKAGLKEQIAEKSTSQGLSCKQG